MNPKAGKSRGEGTWPRPSLAEWLAVRMDVPADVLTGGLRLDMRGRNTLTVHGCTRILDYSPEAVRLRLAEGAVVVTGERLICTSYLAGAVGIEGRICSVTFCDSCDDSELSRRDSRREVLP